MFRYLLNALCLVFVIAIQNFAQQKWVPFTGKENKAPQVSVNSSGQNHVSFTVQIDGMSVEDRKVNEVIYQMLYLQESERMQKEGAPQVPVITKLVTIPDCDDISFSITPGSGIDISDYNIIPVPKHQNENVFGENYAIKNIYEQDKSIYSTDSFFPGKYGEIVETGYVRGQKVARIAVYPIQFNPVSRKIKAYTKFEISLSFVNPSSPVNKELGIFRNMMSHAAINYELKGMGASTKESDIIQERTLRKANSSNSQNMLTSVVTRVTDLNTLIGANAIPIDYIIITHSSLFNSNSLTTLANFRKDHNGYDVAIVRVEDIYNLRNADNTYKYPSTNTTRYISVRDFIKDVYLTGRANNTFDGHLGYILLAGDAYLDDNNTEMIPAVHSPSYFTLEQGGDYYYACTGGDTDNLMDVMYGRLSVGNETQLSNVVNKIISYENNSNNSWCTDNTFVGGNPDFFADYDPKVKTMTEIIPSSCSKSYAYRAFDTSPATQVVEASPVQAYRFTNSQWRDPAYLCGSDLLEEWLFNDPNAGLNNRVHTFVYEGHGGWDALLANEGSGRFIFRGGMLDSKLNNDLYSFMILNCCDAGHLDNTISGPQTDDCIGEKVLYLANKGAIGCLASSRDSDDRAFGYVDGYIIRAMHQNMSHVMGEAVMESKLLLSNSQFRRQYNLYGDPAVNLWPAGFTVAENTTLSGSVQISENLTVPSGITLTISAGADLRFSNGASIIVNGNMVANGTSTSRITFQRIGTSDSWGSITFDGLGVSNSILNNVDMNNGTEIRILNNARVTVSNSNLNNFTNGIYIYNSAPDIIGNHITEPLQNGIYGEASGKSPLIVDNVISKSSTVSQYHHYQGIYMGNSTVPYIAHNHVSGFDWGLYVGGGAHAYCTDRAIRTYSPNNRFTDNRIGIAAGWGGYISGGSPGYNSGNNTISNNVQYDAYSYQNATLLAQNNYWGGGQPGTYKDAGSTLDVSNILSANPWPSGALYAPANVNNPAEYRVSLSKTVGGDSGTDLWDLFEGIRYEKDGRIGDAILWYKALMNLDKYRNFAITELMRINNEYSNTDILSMLEELSLKLKSSYLYKVLGDYYLQNNQFEKSIICYDDAVDKSVSKAEITDADFSKLFGFINVKKDLQKAQEILSEIKTGDLSDFYFSSRVQIAEDLMRAPMNKTGKIQNSEPSASNSEIIKEYALLQNYPNPFNPSTMINFQIPKASKISLKVYDMLGKEVATLVDEYKEMGRYSVRFDASGLSSGMYIYQLIANEYISVRKMMFIK
ncbi:MAG: C25 family cysteine peptidase [Clostridiales bacterium]